MMKINILDPLVANQIAAGEVIERPASIIKECLENSLDAGATQLSIDVAQGGMQSICIFDNGHGIARIDLPNAVKRHGTSKIVNTDDLSAIASLGFRGEALASICAVARVTLASAIQDEPHGWQLIAEGTALKINETPVAHPVGTSITIRDLFFNTPARRRFLRTEKTEFSHIEEVVKRIALSRFNLAIKLTHNQRQIYQLPAATTDILQDKRISQLCSKEFIQHALKISMRATDLHLWGWIGEPTFSRAQADMQYLYINGRMVRDKLITHAIRQAYEHALGRENYPAYVLYLDCDPKNVDVNVHPTKHEVRFHESRLIHDFVFVSLKKALTETSLQENIEPEIFKPGICKKEPLLDAAMPDQYKIHNSYSKPITSSLVIAEQAEIYSRLQSDPEEVVMTDKLFLGEPLTVLAENFLLTKSMQSLGIVHLTKAYALLFQKALSKPNPISKPLLFPITVILTDKPLANISNNFQRLIDLGFILELLGQRQVVLRQTPNIFEKIDYAKFITELAAQIDVDIEPEKLTQQIAQVAASCVRSLESKANQEKLLQSMQQQFSEAELRRCFQILGVESLVRMFAHA